MAFIIFDGGGLAGGMYRLETNSGTTFVDTDGDSLADVQETELLHTDPNNADSDGDGVSDGAEVAAGSSPLDPLSVPPPGDTTPPNITATTITSPNSAGWYNSDVIVRFTCSDAGSGIPAGTCPPDQVLSTEGTAVSSTAQTVKDAAGNTSAPSNVVTVKIDKTSPVVSISGVANGASYVIGAVPPVACVTADVVSGVAGTAVLSLTGGTCGLVTATCTGGTDVAGNLTAPVTATYTVTYQLCAPLVARPRGYNVGSTIPVKVRVCDSSGNNVGSTLLPVRAVGLTPSGTLRGVGKSSPDGFFRFEDGLYVYNLQVQGVMPGTYVLTFQVGNDPTEYQFSVSILEPARP